MTHVLDLPILGERLPDFRRDAACHEAPAGLMLDEDLVDEAKKVCARCMVRVDCLRYALTILPTDGVWGGMTWEDRLLICPACLGPKTRTELACCAGHELFVIAGYLERQTSVRDPQFRVSKRTKVRPKTSPTCGMPHGGDHGTWAAYHARGCKCDEARIAYYEHRGRQPRGPAAPRGSDRPDSRGYRQRWKNKTGPGR